jgi:hypothetical protein
MLQITSYKFYIQKKIINMNTKYRKFQNQFAVKIQYKIT